MLHALDVTFTLHLIDSPRIEAVECKYVSSHAKGFKDKQDLANKLPYSREQYCSYEIRTSPRRFHAI
jgi:hypothetical protein